MSLLTPSTGLLQTHVTWKDVEKAVQKAFKTKARLGEDRTIRPVGGKGLQSLIGLITCYWQGSKDTQIPNELIIKLPSMIGYGEIIQKLDNNMRKEIAPVIKQFGRTVKESHNNEVTAYELLSKADGTLLVPKCYLSMKISEANPLKGMLALEVFENAQSYPVYDNFSMDQMKEVARELGKIQACSITKGLVKKDNLSNDLWPRFWAGLKIDDFTMMIEQWAEFDGSLKEVITQLLSLVPSYFGTDLLHTIHKQFGCGRTLVHGDLWSGNLLMEKGTGKLLSFIDWQNSHFGVGVEDLLRISLSALPTQVRRATKHELLNEMYDSMKNHLNGTNVPYTREQATELYDILLPHAAFCLPPTFSPRLQVIMTDCAPTEALRRAEVITEKDSRFCRPNNEFR